MRQSFLSAVTALGVVSVLAGSASAWIAGVGGAVQQISPPSDCSPTMLPTGAKVFVWDEQQNVNINPLPVDMTVNPSTSTIPTPGFVSGPVDAHFIHFDHLGLAAGSVTFSGQIIGVAFNNNPLDVSDAVVGINTTIYPTTWPFRGMQSLPFLNSLITINANTLTFNFDTISPVYDIDQVRVYTVPVPAPASGALLAAAGLLTARRRRSA